MDLILDISYILCNIILEHPGACHKKIGSGLHYSYKGILIDPAVYLNIHIQPLMVDQFPKLLDLLCTLIYILLSPKPG